jgi:23S rRNA pseudouridine955/2504/2580 synthase
MGAARKTAKRHANAEDAVPTTVGADRVAHVRVDPEYLCQRLDNFLIRLAKGVPKSHVYRIVRSGEVRVNRGRVAADYRLRLGTTFGRRRCAPGNAREPPARARCRH